MLVLAPAARAEVTVQWPGGVTNDPVVTFTSTSPVECSLGGDVYTACESPWRPAVAADGVYRVYVRETGTAFSAGGSFTLDRTAPAIAFTAGPEDGAVQASRSVAYAFSAPGGTLACTWDDAAIACDGGVSLNDLAAGVHVLTARATDALGNAAEVSRRVTIVPPQVSGPDGKPNPVEPAGGVLAGSAAKPSVHLTAKRTRAWTRLKTLRVDDVVAGTTVKATCKGKGCPARAQRIALKRDGRVSLKGLTGRRLRPGTVITIALTRRGAPKQTIRITIRSLAAPRVR